MATYPTDATITTTAFDTIDTVTFSSTGSTTNFNLHPHTVEHVGEVVATADGVEQWSSSKELSQESARFTVPISEIFIGCENTQGEVLLLSHSAGHEGRASIGVAAPSRPI